MIIHQILRPRALGLRMTFCGNINSTSAGASVSLVPSLSESQINRIKGWHGFTRHRKHKPKPHRHSDEALAEEESGNYETAGETLPDPSFRDAQLRMTFHNK